MSLFRLPLLSFLTIICLLMFSIKPARSLAQCSGFPATTADADCNTGTALPGNNANINSGTYSYCGSGESSSATFSNVNLNGGIIRICGNATLSGNWNSGIIVVSCGSTLTFNSSLTLNNSVGIVNYGTVNINGNLNFQNNGNYFYNELPSSKLNVSGDVYFNQNNGNNGYVKNAGYIRIGGTYRALEGSFTCLLDGSQFETGSLIYFNNCSNNANRFTYGSGSSGSAVFRYSGSATLRSSFTSSSLINVYKSSGATQTLSCGAQSTWGSAPITNNTAALTAPSGTQTCSNSTCYTRSLPVKLIYFKAKKETNGTTISWLTATEKDNDYFTLERSTDGYNWAYKATIKGKGNSNSSNYYQYNDAVMTYGKSSYYRLKQTDTDGASSYSSTIEVSTNKTEAITTLLYPNPSAGIINLQLTGMPENDVKVEIFDLSGQKIRTDILTESNFSDGKTIEPILLPESGGMFLLIISVDGNMASCHKVIKN